MFFGYYLLLVLFSSAFIPVRFSHSFYPLVKLKHIPITVTVIGDWHPQTPSIPMRALSSVPTLNEVCAC